MCHAKKDCSVNLTAGTAIKDLIYFWDFGNGETFYGANPKALKFTIGSHVILLRVLNSVSGEIADNRFTVTVQKLLSIKKTKTKKAVAPPIKKESVFSVRPTWQDTHTSSNISKKLTSLQISLAGIVISLVFFVIARIFVRRRLQGLSI